LLAREVQLVLKIRILLSESWIRGSGSNPKCHGF